MELAFGCNSDQGISGKFWAWAGVRSHLLVRECVIVPDRIFRDLV